MLDFDAYLERIGLARDDSPTWQAIHRARATSIPFENLDSHQGIPGLAPDKLEHFGLPGFQLGENGRVHAI